MVLDGIGWDWIEMIGLDGIMWDWIGWDWMVLDESDGGRGWMNWWMDAWTDGWMDVYIPMP